MTDPSSPPIRRILVALDSSNASLQALRTAVSLAAEMQADLAGLFVEDLNLIHVGGLPFTVEVRLTSAAARPVKSHELEAALRREAALARRALLHAAEKAQVRATFQVVRGRVTPEVLAAAREADLLILGRVSRPLTARRRAGSTARAAVLDAPHSVLLALDLPDRAARHLVVPFNGSSTASLALNAALNLTGSEASLTVLLITTKPAEADHWEAEIRAIPTVAGLSITFRRHSQLSSNTLIEAIRQAGGDLLVLPGDSQETIDHLLEHVDCSLLIVRE